MADTGGQAGLEENAETPKLDRQDSGTQGAPASPAAAARAKSMARNARSTRPPACRVLLEACTPHQKTGAKCALQSELMIRAGHRPTCSAGLVVVALVNLGAALSQKALAVPLSPRQQNPCTLQSRRHRQKFAQAQRKPLIGRGACHARRSDARRQRASGRCSRTEAMDCADKELSCTTSRQLALQHQAFPTRYLLLPTATHCCPLLPISCNRLSLVSPPQRTVWGPLSHASRALPCCHI